MKKKKHLRETVTHYVAASGLKKKQKRSSMKDFFEDLENRGPFTPNSLFEKWTKEIRVDMEEAGSWIQDSFEYQQEIEFVAEYLSRFQTKFVNFVCTSLSEHKHMHFTDILDYPSDCKKAFRVFRKVYIKIRIWGLRKKLFILNKWETTSWGAYARPLHSIKIKPLQDILVGGIKVHAYWISVFEDEFFCKRNMYLNHNL